MALQHAKLADIQYLGSSAGSLYANPSSTKTYVRGFILHNTDSSAIPVKIYNVPDSAGSLGTASAANEWLTPTLPAKETLIIALPFPIVLTDTNDAVFGEAGTASKITVLLLGDKE